ncbi:MAG: tol-pal system protein YbgF [Arenimonas sp.]
MKPFAALALLSLVLLSTTLASPSAFAQKRSLADRVATLEQQSAAQGNASGQQNVELVNRIAQMQAEVQALRNQVETLQNENEQLKQRSREQYVDLDSRLQRVEGASAAPASASTMPPRPAAARPAANSAVPLTAPRPASGAGGDEAYAVAFQALKRDDFVESARAFQAYLRDYPDGSLAPNAWYWLGESYYVTQNYPLALQAFDTVLSRFRDSGKAADAKLKKGYCQIELGQAGPGAATLNAVINEFPGSDAARLAASRLRALSLPPR